MTSGMNAGYGCIGGENFAAAAMFNLCRSTVTAIYQSTHVCRS